MKKTVNATDRKNIMTLAWNFFRQTGMSFSECLHKAWANFKLKAQMRMRIVRFYYQKIDGSIREAWGTLMNVEDRIKGDRRSQNPTVQVYWDTEKNAFRCFKKFNIVSVQ